MKRGKLKKNAKVRSILCLSRRAALSYSLMSAIPNAAQSAMQLEVNLRFSYNGIAVLTQNIQFCNLLLYATPLGLTLVRHLTVTSFRLLNLQEAHRRAFAIVSRPRRVSNS